MLADDRRRRRDRRLLWRALLVAGLLHAAFVLLRIPEMTRALPQVAEREPPNITRPEIVPPPMPERSPVRDRAPIEFRDPVPLATVPVLEPLEHDDAPTAPPTEPETPAVDVDFGIAQPPPVPEIFEEGDEGLEPPVPLPDRLQPEYPEAARIAKVEGRVILVATVDTAGRVVALEVLWARRPDIGFSESALEAVSTWRYEPGRYRGRAVPVRIRVEVDFDLQ
jgi:protein TonB